jgi:rare lipoprotein A (peptidoglycan hydrolase)
VTKPRAARHVTRAMREETVRPEPWAAGDARVVFGYGRRTAWDKRGRGLACAIALLAFGGCATPSGTGSQSLAPYTVEGRRYAPVRQWQGFVEDGLASWYGRSYQGRPTASGEPFDAHALTAAHPVLPMQVCVQVTNPENHQAVVVRINDRGPFAPGRIIDLSEAAATGIGMLDDGVARVHLVAIASADARGACPNAPEAPRLSADPRGR